MLVEATVLASFAALFLASAQDMRSGEISDKVSYSYIIAVHILAAAAAINAWDVMLFLKTVGFSLAYFILAYIFFLLGQWGGGDVKLMAGIGATLGLTTLLGYPYPQGQFTTLQVHPAIAYLINLSIISAPYAIAYTMVVGAQNPRCVSEFLKRLSHRRTGMYLILSLVPAVASQCLGQYHLSLVYCIIPLFYIATVYMKAVEKTALTKTIAVADLSDWDILSQDLYVDGKRIAKRANIEGVTPEQVQAIKKLAKKDKIPKDIDIRWGIKYVPALFLGLIITLYLGNLMQYIILYISQIH